MMKLVITRKLRKCAFLKKTFPVKQLQLLTRIFRRNASLHRSKLVLCLKPKLLMSPRSAGNNLREAVGLCGDQCGLILKGQCHGEIYHFLTKRSYKTIIYLQNNKNYREKEIQNPP